MTINDDFTNKAEAEMKMHDAKMMEQAMIKKLMNAPINEKIIFALKKSGNDPEKTLEYLMENHLIGAGDSLDLETIRKYIP
jgi:hypothetical protein